MPQTDDGRQTTGGRRTTDQVPYYKLWAFLALLDYVSRAHEIKIRHSSVRLWHRLSLNLLHVFLSTFGCCPDVFGIFEKKWGIFYEYF